MLFGPTNNQTNRDHTTFITPGRGRLDASKEITLFRRERVTLQWIYQTENETPFHAHEQPALDAKTTSTAMCAKQQNTLTMATHRKGPLTFIKCS